MSQTDTENPPVEYYRDYSSLSWAQHWIYQLDGKGGRVGHQAQLRYAPLYKGKIVTITGLAKMDNGEIAAAGTVIDPSLPGKGTQAAIMFTKDLGATWSDYHLIEDLSFTSRPSAARPMMLAYSGNGELSFRTSWAPDGDYRLYSKDYGRTWSERVKLDPAPNGSKIGSEGNMLIDYDETGKAVLMAETGQTTSPQTDSEHRCFGCIRWSRDAGRSWENFSWPKEWVWQDTYEGKTYQRGAGEGALVRAENGWIVAAMRTDMPIRYVPLHHDNFEGIAVSISKDEGKSWSDLNFLFGPGRMHANLLRLANGDLLMTMVKRMDLKDNGRLASYRHGCEAVISHDNGLSWDVEHMYVLDEFSGIGIPPEKKKHQVWRRAMCGHLFSILLDDGRVLTTYGNYKCGGTFILWKP